MNSTYLHCRRSSFVVSLLRVIRNKLILQATPTTSIYLSTMGPAQQLERHQASILKAISLITTSFASFEHRTKYWRKVHTTRSGRRDWDNMFSCYWHQSVSQTVILIVIMQNKIISLSKILWYIYPCFNTVIGENITVVAV